MAKVPYLKRTLGILFAEGAFFSDITSKGLNHQFGRLDYRITGLMTPLIDWQGPLKGLFFYEYAFVLEVSFGDGIDFDAARRYLFSEELGGFHDHLVPKRIGFGLVEVDILDIEVGFSSNFIHLKNRSIYIISSFKFRNLLKLNCMEKYRID